jgi:hypothetical protein
MLYNEFMDEPSSQTYTPEIQSRRSEYVAWGLALASLAGLLVLNLGGMIYFWAIVFVAFMVMAALSISFGNWMDRQTSLVLDEHSATYKNGLRRVHLEWPAIKSVSTRPSRWGEKVQVVGENAHFDFNTLGEVIYQDQVQGRVGFQHGEIIKNTLIEKSGLSLVAKKGDSYYYSRP